MTLQELLNTPISQLNHSGELKHYASEYYDPVKAHEYYMEHRKLKGEVSSGSTDESSNSSNSSTETSIQPKTTSTSSGSYEEEYEKYSFETNKKIQALQRRLGRLSKEARMLLSDEIYAEIDKLREDNMNKKRELKQKYGKGSGSNGSSSISEKTSAAYKEKWSK